ncbi:CBS domain-containing protein [Roseomonas sp. JC162]|uniref:CBS domain-containing protein n=1 Tax=Neoroseomonas marina TaxID=1232220 RepID=A0A848EHQ1_9PROT|nr:CBS domain-containing protein [Neoroseomonas marina]NMJ42960.1 CBS domain-containing protein [Neoroseomonas marina]
MKVSDAMTRQVQVVNPAATVAAAARVMAEMDAGALPVGENDRLLGMITDRDIAIRGVAMGRGPQTPVREVMTGEVKYCFSDQELDEVLRNMAEIQVRRLPVVDRGKRLVGILSLGDAALATGGPRVGDALGGICRPGGARSQTG